MDTQEIKKLIKKNPQIKELIDSTRQEIAKENALDELKTTVDALLSVGLTKKEVNDTIKNILK